MYIGVAPHPPMMMYMGIYPLVTALAAAVVVHGGHCRLSIPRRRALAAASSRSRTAAR